MTADDSESRRKTRTLFRTLAHRRRRLTLRCLETHHCLSLADVAGFVAEREADRPLTEIDGETVRDVYLSLYHRHVPKLEAADLVTYHQETDTVAVDADIARVVATLRSELADVVGDVRADSV
jgi:hypothetical protein